tara:strand:- start:1013 stop:1777 length:765 start_codon:yes stop_codon:yes gene_type:complete
MAFDLQSITSGSKEMSSRIILLGTEKIGKTTFAADFPSPIFLPIKGEEGVDDLDVNSFPRAETYDDVMSAIKTLIKDKHSFETFIIDSASALEPIVWDKLCEEHECESIEKVGGGYGKGYTEALHKWRQLMDGLDLLRMKGITVIIIGHVKVKRFDDPLGLSFDQYQFDIHEKVHLTLQRWADSILFCSSETIVQTEDVGFKEKRRGRDLTGDRFIYTQKRPAHAGGGRGVYGRLPYKIPLSFQSFNDAVQAAK